MSCQNSHVRAATNAPCTQSRKQGNYNTVLISVTIKYNNINKTTFPWVSPIKLHTTGPTLLVEAVRAIYSQKAVPADTTQGWTNT